MQPDKSLDGTSCPITNQWIRKRSFLERLRSFNRKSSDLQNHEHFANASLEIFAKSSKSDQHSDWTLSLHEW